jgi:hypothetical protein
MILLKMFPSSHGLKSGKMRTEAHLDPEGTMPTTERPPAKHVASSILLKAANPHASQIKTIAQSRNNRCVRLPIVMKENKCRDAKGLFPTGCLLCYASAVGFIGSGA